MSTAIGQAAAELEQSIPVGWGGHILNLMVSSDFKNNDIVYPHEHSVNCLFVEFHISEKLMLGKVIRIILPNPLNHAK